MTAPIPSRGSFPQAAAIPGAAVVMAREAALRHSCPHPARSANFEIGPFEFTNPFFEGGFTIFGPLPPRREETLGRYTGECTHLT